MQPYLLGFVAKMNYNRNNAMLCLVTWSSSIPVRKKSASFQNKNPGNPTILSSNVFCLILNISMNIEQTGLSILGKIHIVPMMV